MKIKTAFALSMLMAFGSSAPVFANDGVPETLAAFYVSHFQNRYPGFRIVKTIETYPERYNATIPFDVTTSLSDGQRDLRALITLHDGSTGEPLESCYAPCTLHKSHGRRAFVVAYKYGYLPLPVTIDDPEDMLKFSRFWDGKYQIHMGINYAKAARKAKSCDREFAKLPKTDSEARPCFRHPPLVPQVEYSGYCKVAFDLTVTGRTENLRTTDCTDPVFETPSLMTVSTWKYHPKIERGVAVPRKGIESKLRYDITDYDGHLLDQDGKRVDVALD